MKIQEWSQNMNVQATIANCKYGDQQTAKPKPKDPKPVIINVYPKWELTEDEKAGLDMFAKFLGMDNV